MLDRICSCCNRIKHHHAKGLCMTCYKKQYWKPRKGVCINCDKFIIIHAKNKCVLCYNKTIRYNGKIKERNKCIICGFNMGIHIHHIDKDRKNNSIENLVPICANHHILLHSPSMGKKIKKILSKKIISGMS